MILSHATLRYLILETKQENFLAYFVSWLPLAPAMLVLDLPATLIELSTSEAPGYLAGLHSDSAVLVQMTLSVVFRYTRESRLFSFPSRHARLIEYIETHTKAGREKQHVFFPFRDRDLVGLLSVSVFAG